MTKKPKIMGPGKADDFQTPPEALDPLLPWLQQFKDWGYLIWEPACGTGNLSRRFDAEGWRVKYTDRYYQFKSDTWRSYDWVKSSDPVGLDFLSIPASQVPSPCILVTNPPYSIKDDFLEHCYDLQVPFALLMPLTALEGRRRQEMFKANGVQVLVMKKRLQFTTPNGPGTSSYFMTAWFTWGLRLPSALVFE